MSDPQFGMYAQNKGFEQETANFEFAIAAANRLHPAFVIVSGDLVNKPGDAAEIAEYKRIAARLNPSIPFYSLPGNHDIGDQPAGLAAWRKAFGRDYYTFRAGDAAIFVLDSVLMTVPVFAGEEAAQEKWLAAELEKAAREGPGPRIVILHHPLFIKTPDEPDQYFNVPGAVRKRYLELFRKYGVSHVFAGHYHRNALAKDGAIEMVTTGPVGKPLGQERSGFRVVVLRANGVEHRYYDFGALPDRMDPGRSLVP